jgi:hypothetical protein
MSIQDDKRKEALRKNIESNIERAEQLRRQELLSRRTEIAREGTKHYQNNRIAEAVKSFHLYIKLLEDWKQVRTGQMGPHNFDKVMELPEIILLSGVYWDLAKIYDGSKDPKISPQITIYLDKYILFSKGFSHEPLCAESMRKYINKNKPRHIALFKAAYKRYGRSECFVVTSLLDVTEPGTLDTFRSFRDQVLVRNLLGKGFTAFYYQIGPSVAFLMDRCPAFFRKRCGKTLDSIAKIIRETFRFDSI